MKKFLFLILIVLAFICGCSKKTININESDKFNLLFNIDEKANQQGLTYHNKIYYVGFDVGNNHGMIIAYDNKGKEVKRTNYLEIGHTAELDYYNNKIYVANGGKKPAMVYIVDFNKNKIDKIIDAKKYGHGALIAVKNSNTLILHTAKNNGKHEHIFNFIDSNGIKKKSFTIASIGMPQGMDYQNGKIYFYTNNKITIINEKGDILNTINLNNIRGESEGLTIVNGNIAVGYNSNNRIYIN